MKVWWLVLVCACRGGSHGPADALLFIDAPADVSADAPKPFGFQPAQRLQVLSDPVAVAIGDLDGDARPDIAVAERNGQAISIVHDTGTGPSRTDIYLAAEPQWLALADLNGDGKLDIVLIDGAVTILLNTTTVPGSPTFSGGTDFPLETQTTGSVAVADFNGDGRLDLVEPYFCSTTALCMSVLLNATPTNSATPAFETRADIQTTDRGFFAATGDLDGDTLPDIFLDYRSEHVGVFVNATAHDATAPVFTSHDITVSTSDGNCAVVADLDHDGRNDLAFCNGGLTILPNTTTAPGAPSFGTAVDLTAPSGTFTELAAADVDGDGMLDLVVPDVFANTVTVHRNTGGFTFEPGIATSVGSQPESLAVGDLNHDGHADAVTANQTDDSISVLLAN